MTAWATPLTTTVLPLRSRRARTVIPALLAALLLGGPVAAFALAVVAGVGVEPMTGSAGALLLAIAVAALAPAAVLVRRMVALRRPASLVIDPDAVTIAYPEQLRRPLVVPRAAIRIAAVESEGRERFRIHAASGPYFGGDDDRFLWRKGWSPLPIAAPAGVAPNVLLVFDPPAAGADVRRSRLGGVYRGERLAGLLLAAHDASDADRALAALGVTRPLTMPDALAIERHLDAPAGQGGRRGVERHHTVRLAWASVAIGIVAPPIAILGVLVGVVLAFGGDRRHGAAMALSGLTVVAVRVALYV
jgi:hypothetical protein